MRKTTKFGFSIIALAIIAAIVPDGLFTSSFFWIKSYLGTGNEIQLGKQVIDLPPFWFSTENDHMSAIISKWVFSREGYIGHITVDYKHFSCDEVLKAREYDIINTDEGRCRVSKIMINGNKVCEYYWIDSSEKERNRFWVSWSIPSKSIMLQALGVQKEYKADVLELLHYLASP